MSDTFYRFKGKDLIYLVLDDGDWNCVQQLVEILGPLKETTLLASILGRIETSTLPYPWVPSLIMSSLLSCKYVPWVPSLIMSSLLSCKYVLRCAQICTLITKIKNLVKEQVEILTKVGFKTKVISTNYHEKYNNIKSHAYRKKLSHGLPTKIKVYRGYFKGRIPRIIKRYIEENPMARVDEIKAGCNLLMSSDIFESLFEFQQRTIAKRSIFLKDVHRQKRLAFAQSMLQKSDQYLHSILWSDETMVKACPNGETVFYRALQDRSDIVTLIVQQGGAGQMLWGCLSIGAYGPLVVIDGFINGNKYLNLLQTHVRPELEAARVAGRVLVYQQDNAKPHKTREVLKYFERWGYEVIDWPPESPDLSQIENFWNMMKRLSKTANQGHNEGRNASNFGQFGRRFIGEGSGHF
jgi:transposase